MSKRLILGLGSIVLLASSLAAGSIDYDRDYYSYTKHKKSHKQIKKSHYTDSYYLSRAEKREIRKMREMKRNRMKAKERMLESNSRQHEFNRVLAVINITALPVFIHDAHMKHLAYRY